MKLVLVLVFIRFAMTQKLMRHEKLEMFLNQKWEMSRNLVDLAVKLRFYASYSYTRMPEYVKEILKISVKC